MPYNFFSCNSCGCNECVHPESRTCNRCNQVVTIPTQITNSLCTGCLTTVAGSCTYYSGTTTPCLGITTGTTLDNVIKAIDTKICSIPGVSGVDQIYVVSGVSGQTTVTTTVIGNTTYYTVRLSPSVVSQINTNTTNISTINGIIPTLTDTITSSTLVVTHPNGHTWNIEASGLTTPRNCTGTTYSDFVKHDTSSSSNMIDSTQDFTTAPCPAITTGDTITYRIMGSYTMGAPPSEFTVSIMNGASVIQTRVGSNNTSSGAINTTSAFSIELKLFVTSTTTAILNCTWADTYTAPQAVPSNYGISLDATQKQAIGKHLTGLDFSALRVKVDQTAGTGGVLNFVNTFTSEVFKHY